MPEVQKHGFIWEMEIKRKVYNLTESEILSIPYTSEADIPRTLNRIDGADVSIKTTGTPNTVCMGDCLRIYDEVSSGTPLHLTVITYNQVNPTTKTITQIVTVDLTSSSSELFGTLTRADIEELDRAVKAIPQKRKPTPEEHTAMYTIQKRLQLLSGALYMNIKCDSKQSRLQCSFNQFQKFLKEHPSRIIAQSTTHEFRGGQLIASITSSRRKFKTKDEAQ